MYVDESGDCGTEKSPTRYFILSGLIIHELRWQDCLDQLKIFRQRMKGEHGLRMRDEIHAAHFISRPGPLAETIKRYDRLKILRDFADQLAGMPDLNVINVVLDKNGKKDGYDVFEMAWKALIQRFENTITHRNFNGPQNADERGLIFPDNTDNKKLTQLLRKMRRHNPIPNAYSLGYRQMPLVRLVEDPNFRDSSTSYYIQAVDLIAYLLYQKYEPSKYIRQKSGQNYFARLEPILCKKASPKSDLGIVEL
jgi:hypothetical protein